MSEHTPDAQVVVDTAIAAVDPEPVDPDVLYSVVVPDGANHKVVDLEQYLDQPRRLKGTVALQRVEDLERYIERHDDSTHTTIWVDAEQRKVVAVLNDHGADSRQWGDHRAELQLKHTPAWEHWLRLDGKMLPQQDLAEHIEDRLIDIVEPDAATMLEIAQSIEGSVNASFKSAKRLQNGQVGIEYVEDTAASAGPRGELEIPDRFKLGIAVFEGEDAYEITARFRYRVRGGDLSLGYRLERPEDILRDAVEQVRDRLGQRFQIERVFVGRPR